MKDVNLNKDNNKNISKTDNEKQMSNLNIGGNKNKTAMNKNKTVDKSKSVNKNKTTMNKNKNVDKSKVVDKSKSKNINNINTKITYKYKSNIDLEKKKIKRPGLNNREIGSIIKFKAILVGKYAKFSNCVTIINLHRGKEYLADHTQLMLNETLEKLYKRNTIKSCLI